MTKLNLCDACCDSLLCGCYLMVVMNGWKRTQAVVEGETLEYLQSNDNLSV